MLPGAAAASDISPSNISVSSFPVFVFGCNSMRVLMVRKLHFEHDKNISEAEMEVNWK